MSLSRGHRAGHSRAVSGRIGRPALPVNRNHVGMPGQDIARHGGSRSSTTGWPWPRLRRARARGRCRIGRDSSRPQAISSRLGLRLVVSKPTSASRISTVFRSVIFRSELPISKPCDPATSRATMTACASSGKCSFSWQRQGPLPTAHVSASHGQELKVGLSAEPSAMDPHFHNLTPNTPCCGTSSTADAPGREQAVVPGLALSWAQRRRQTGNSSCGRASSFTDGSDFTATT